MAETPRIGLVLPQRGVFFGATTIPQLVELGRLADRSGAFEAVWVGDSLTAKPRPEAVTLLGTLAGATEGVALGVGCMASFPVRDPVVFAYQWATLDRVSGGRTILAVCTGLVSHENASAREGAHFGVTDRERASRMEENIEICRRLWEEEAVSYRGRFRSFQDLTIEPRPSQQPYPIWIASNPVPGSRFYQGSLERVARMADGWMTVTRVPGQFGRIWADLADHLSERGRDLSRFPRAAYHNVNVGVDRRTALEESKRFLDHYYGPVFSEDMVEAWTAAGTPEECASDLQELVGQGATDLALRIASWEQEAQLEILSEEVLPRLGG